MSAGLIVGYLLFLLLALIAPFAGRVTKADEVGGAGRLGPISWIGIFMATGMLFARLGTIFPLAPLLMIPALSRGTLAVVGSGVATILFAPVVWWTVEYGHYPIAQWVAFAIVTVAFGLMLQRFSVPPEAAITNQKARILPAFLIGCAVALVAGFYASPFNENSAAQTAWHHWGAYLAPVEALLSGGTPYRDFPIQYGIGPTLVLAAACGKHCWYSMYWVVMAMNAIYLGALFGGVAILTSRSSPIFRIVAFVAMFCAAMLWTGFPKDFATAMSTPSVAGLRFLPLALLLFFILHSENDARTPHWPGHAIWLFGAVWSIESAAFVSMLWWPWLAYRSLGDNDNFKAVGLSVFKYATLGAAALLCAELLLLASYYVVYGHWPETDSLLAYFQNPPGPLPPFIFGPLAMVLCLCIMAIALLLRNGFRLSGATFACLVAFLASFSYYLSRSHDNNLLNLFPFLLLVVLCLWRSTPGDSADDIFTAYLRERSCWG